MSINSTVPNISKFFSSLFPSLSCQACGKKANNEEPFFDVVFTKFFPDDMKTGSSVKEFRLCKQCAKPIEDLLPIINSMKHLTGKKQKLGPLNTEDLNADWNAKHEDEEEQDN